jgi:perosamine synthetase
MKIRRTIPPAAAMIGFRDLLCGMAGFLFGGKYLRDLEAGLKRYFGVRHIFLVSSGKAALTIILKALQSLSPKKREVLIPAYTCYSVPSAIVKAGLKVSLCDMNSATLDFDHALLADAINDTTLCIVPTHLFGIPADVERVKGMCRNRGIFVVAAESLVPSAM